MTRFQKIVKYLAIALAVVLVFSIISGILGVVGILRFWRHSDAVGEMIQYPVDGEIAVLEIELHAAELTIEKSESFFVESNLKELTVTQKNGTVIIREKDSHLKNYNGAVLKIGIPENHTFSSACLVTGAGKADIDVLSAQKLALEMGAGEVKINTLHALQKAEMEGGAGRITIADGFICNLELEMGVGRLDLTAALLGSSELNLGVGETELTLLQAEGDYTVCLEEGVGNATLNGQKMENEFVYGNGANRVELEGGVGNIRVTVTDAVDS